MAHYKSASYSNSNPKNSSPLSHSLQNSNKFNTSPIIAYDAIDFDISNLRLMYHKSKHDRLMTESEITLLKTKIKILTMEERKISKSTERELKASKALKQIHINKKANKDMIDNYKQKQDQYIKVKRSKLIKERQSSLEKRMASKQRSDCLRKTNYCSIARMKEDNEKYIHKERNKTASQKKQRYLQFKALQNENREKKLQEKMSKKKEIVKELECKITNEEKMKESLKKCIIKYQNQGIKIVERLGMMADNCTISQIILANNTVSD